MIGISERVTETKGWDIFNSNKEIFIKFWETYISNKNLFNKGYIESPCERKSLLQNEIKFDEKTILIPSITIVSEKNCIIIPICFSERQCVFKKFLREEINRKLYLIPICFNEKYIKIKFLKELNTEKIIIAKKCHVDTKHLITKLPPHLTAYNFRKIITYFLPPNTDERKIFYEKFHVKFNIPREFDVYYYFNNENEISDSTEIDYYQCYHYDYTDSTSVYDVSYCLGIDHIIQEYYDGENFIFEINSEYEKILDGTTTGSYFENLEIGLDEGFDYGELFLIDLENNNIFNLSLDSIYLINIYGNFTKNLFLMSNQNNLFIKTEPDINYDKAKEIFHEIYNISNENIETFKKLVLDEIFNHNYLSIKINSYKSTYIPTLFKKLPRRFLIPFEIYINDIIKEIVYSLHVTYYFPYRFKNMSKKYKVILLNNYI